MSSQRYFSLIASSATADYVATDRSEFTIRFQEAVTFPKNAFNMHVEVTAAEVWNVFPNIKTGENKLYVTYNSVTYILTIPQGQYALVTLQDAIERELTNAGAAANLIKVSSDAPTQRVEIIFSQVGISIDFTQVDTFRTLLGFESKVITSTLQGQYVLADNTARFNTINSLLIHSNLVTQGIQVNGSYSQTIAQLFIDSEPGSQILYRPFQPTEIGADHLAGQLITSISFRLTNEQNINVDTNGENWSLRLKISYSTR